MEPKKSTALIIVSAAVIPLVWAAGNVSQSASQSATFVSERGTLRGLQGVGVVVVPTKPEVKRRGLHYETLQTYVELQLRQYGIKVLTEEERQEAPGKPYLHVNVTVLMNERIPLAAAYVAVALRQDVLLMRDLTTLCEAATWERGTVVRVGLDNLQQIRDTIKDNVAEFINDYLAVNPKTVYHAA